MRAVRLRTDYLENPIGLGDRNPRFYWNDEGGVRQSAYRIVCTRDGRVIWDSGKVESSSMSHIGYQGEPLKSRDRVEWSVQVWDEEGKSEEDSRTLPDEASCEGGNNVSDKINETAYFEEGLLDASDWKALWISGNYKPKKNLHYPVDCFRKEFRVEKPGDVVKARLYASARGLYDVTINGNHLDNQVMTPGITDYRKRIQYQTYDVTELFTEKENAVIELRLADGWFRGSCAAYSVMDVYGTQTSVIAQLELTYRDGSVQTVVTNGSWEWSDDGPLRFADLKDGEVYDARMTPSYSGMAKTVKAPAAPLVASNNVPVGMHERFTPKLLKSKTGKIVLDFGQNLAGWIEFSLNGKSGQQVVLTLGEVLDANGDVDLRGVQEAKPVKGWSQITLIKKLMGKPLGGQTEMTPQQKIVFNCRDGENHYRTAFAVFGFRYAEIEGNVCTSDSAADAVVIDPARFASIAVYSSMEETGDYTCSNELVNQLVRNTRWSMKSNFLDIPTDCPTRERLGWTGDAQIFFHSGAYLMNTAPFFAKWLHDMEDSQYKNGVLPAVLPYEGVEMMYKSTGTSVGWADAVYLIPYRYYLEYGDFAELKSCWPMIRKYSDYLLGHTGMTDRKMAKENPYNRYTYEKGIHLGEWLEPEEFRDKVYGASAKHPEECTAYFYYSMKTIGWIADLMGEQDYAAKLRENAAGAKKAYDWLIVQKGLLDTDRQAKLVRPLALGLLDDEEDVESAANAERAGTSRGPADINKEHSTKKLAQDRLLRAVENYHYRVGTGFLSTPFILPVLTDAGHSDAAYRMLENEERPGWLSEVKAGATTIWENWEGNLSQNHYSPGAVCEWLFRDSAGIRVEGENHFVIHPVVDQSMRFVKGTYQSLYGRVETEWRQGDENVYDIYVTIPANTTADVILPDGKQKSVTAGEYQYRIRRGKNGIENSVVPEGREMV